jgi:hypothetical protein
MDSADEKDSQEFQSDCSLNNLKLPESLRSAGDPIDENPFSKDDIRYQVWPEATLTAEQDICQLNSNFLKQSPAQGGFDAWMQRDGAASAQKDLDSWSISLSIEKFDIWARRGIHVVWSENAVRGYDGWLFNFAEAWLTTQKQKRCLSNRALAEFRSKLIERVEWWKGEARRYLVLQREHGGASQGPESRSGMLGARKHQDGNVAAAPELNEGKSENSHDREQLPVAAKKRAGRPRKDADRRKVLDLCNKNKTWGEIETIMNKELPEKEKKTKDAYPVLASKKVLVGRDGVSRKSYGRTDLG